MGRATNASVQTRASNQLQSNRPTSCASACLEITPKEGMMLTTLGIVNSLVDGVDAFNIQRL
jgi:hypothetical protein